MKHDKGRSLWNKFYFSNTSSNEIDFMFRAVQKEITVYQKIKDFVRNPLKFVRRKDRTHEHVETLRVMNHLQQMKIYRKSLFLFGSLQNPKMAKEFEEYGRVDLEKYAEKEIFGYLKFLISKKLTRLVPEKKMFRILQIKDTDNYLPQIVQKIITDDDPYRSCIIQMILQLMARIYEHMIYNRIDEATVVFIFMPLFLGEDLLKKMKKKNPDMFDQTAALWRKILLYLPKGRLR